MSSYKIVKVLQRVAVIFLITVFSVAGIVACSADVTEPSVSQTPDELPDPGDTGPTTPEEPTPTFPEDTYYKVYAPWVQWREEQAPNGWVTNVSYQDTNTLTKIWKDQIAGGKYNDDRRWFIRDCNNNQNDHRLGSYYYFDKNFDIVYYRQGKGSLTVRKFLSGIIVRNTKTEEITELTP